MGRLSKELLEQIRKNPPTYWLGSRGITLFEHIDAIELELKIAKEDEERVLKAAERMTENIAQLQFELNKAREPKKVVLPKEVAEAIEFYRHFVTSAGHLISYNPYEIKRRAKEDGNPYAVVLSDYMFHKGFNTYFNALINGYTVEQTKEERLREGLNDLIEVWDSQPTCNLDDLINRVTAFVTKFNAEN